MITPNDTLLTRESQKLDFTKCPTIDKIKKEDKRHHPKQNVKLQRLTPDELYKINRRQFVKNYLLIHCPVCGHRHPISRFLYKRIKDELRKEWARDMNNKLTPQQRKDRAIKAGTIRAIKAGQILKPSTIQKCTRRQISL